MIIKSLSRKTPSFDQLLAYMLEPKGAQVGILSNLPPSGRSASKILQEFEQNHALLPRRANGNALFHEIIALEPNDKTPIKRQVAALRVIAARYLELRAPQQLAVGVVHAETAHVHMHLMISSNAVLSSQRVWMKKAEFAEIQREMEAFRLERFPELGAARHYERGGLGIKSSSREQAARTRTGAPSHKEELAASLANVLANARNRDGLTAALAALDLTLYQRGRSVGVETVGGRRYRFSTLGLAEAYTEAAACFELIESRLASLQRGRSGRSRERGWERD